MKTANALLVRTSGVEAPPSASSARPPICIDTVLTPDTVQPAWQKVKRSLYQVMRAMSSRTKDEDRARPLQGMTGKREAILRAARSVFGRIGYRGASIDVIAAEAEVSTRTIYNHFESKEELFTTVLTESSHQVAAAHESIIQHHLGKVTNLETDLVALAKAWVTPMPEFADHCAMVRRINAEADNFPRELYDAWQQAGPLRVHRALAKQMAGLADRELIEVDDPGFAALHFTALLTATVNSRALFGATRLDPSDIDKIANMVVRAFLNGYLPKEQPGRG